ncbi:N-acetylmuramoyl-L-alanine amidase-like domain-containing protein [uncultured Prevotella sp.]|uniref:N-acetylmuramoyl-L-alanine amidase-like domain-containing protein n=1 Tax=uncultured Prevotella sp. TaxID=159272 RepID=UPI0027E358E3|nr:N-acetylmuramoyl-L-alanine amidase-like domain-containing protein [uncultured Prevotella sp.]
MKTLLIALALLSQCSTAKNSADNNTKKYVANKTNSSADSLTTPNIQNAEPQHNDFAIVSNSEDQKRIETILSKYAKHNTSVSSLIIALAREFKGVPYVAKTLENDSIENLVVNTRQLDCTTYVENVLAIYLCIKNQKLSFTDYCSYLRQIRYVGGKVSYPTRQHYFTEWIDENTKDGFVEELQSPNPPFTATQYLRINFMSKHTSLYPMLKNNPELVKPIAQMESRLSGNTYRFIPKASIANTKLFRSTIHDGDIIAITTSKAGLDTSHIGIAIWHKDGLHMLNASQIHKKVVEEPMTLYQYMQKHPSQTGIRIVRVK